MRRRVLMVENHVAFADVVTAKFLADCEVHIATDVSDAIARLRAEHFDVALVDYDLDDGKGVDVLHWLAADRDRIPVIAISSHEHGNALLMAAGASAVCGKHEFAEIRARIEAVLR